MGIKCPKCQSGNPDTASYCADCGTHLPSSKDIPITATLETPTEELTRGTLFASRYEIIEELGKGGMGKVYRVEDKKIKEEIALKLIKPEIASDRKTIERFSNELKIARKIAHRNVCRMYDLGEEKGTHFITMEYVPGQDLRGLSKQTGQLAASTALSIAKQVCEGLTEAHRLGVIHRDLKPHNIMIDKEGNARIMDFGIARSLTAKGITGAGVMIGTPEYMSPEQVESKVIDQRSDIYSLGVILYEMITGRVPFEGETPLSIAMKHKSETPKDPRKLNTQIPEDLSRVILKCMEKDKEKRYQSANELRSELENIEEGIPTSEKALPKRKPLTSREITVTFGLKKLFIPALIFGALVIAVVMVIWQPWSQKAFMAAPKIDNSIAVISFENQTGDKSYDHLQKVIPSLLRTNLEDSNLFYVVTRERIRDICKQLGKEEVDFIDNDLGFEICRREGVGALVTGFYTKGGDIFTTAVTVYDVGTKQSLTSTRSSGIGEQSFFENQIDELSREISLGIGIAKQELEAAKLKVANVTTNSMEAYRNFIEGREAFENLRLVDARKFLEKAVESDENFAFAYHFLSRTYSMLHDPRARDESIKKAMPLLNKVTEKERLLIEVTYERYIERNQEKRFQILKELTEKYPKEKRAHVWLGNYYSTRDYNKAIEEFNKALELDPSFGRALNMLAHVYNDKEEFKKALKYFKEYEALNPGEPNPPDSLGNCYFLMGRLDEALTKLKEAIQIDPDFYAAYYEIGYIHALKGDYTEALNWIDRFIDRAPTVALRHVGYLYRGFYRYWLGSFRQSLIDLQKAATLAEETGNVIGKAWVDRMKGYVYYDRNELESSGRHHKIWPDFFSKNSPINIQYFNLVSNVTLGLVDLKEGRIDSAKQKFTEIKGLSPESTTPNQFFKEWAKFYYDLLSAEIFLLEGIPEKAIAVFENAPLVRAPLLELAMNIIIYNASFINRDILARAYLQNGEIDKAIAEYERLVSFDPKSRSRHLVHPKYFYKLAKLYEEKGWKGKAIENYQKFLDLWKDADPGFAELEDARKRLAGLKS
jgi:serine/threonine protein kinase/tetratricopeptide (TPR) repeat protein